MFDENFYPMLYEQEGLSKMEHSEGKWEISQEGMNIEIYSDHVGKIANISADYINAHPNAHHICKCVNGWDELQKQRDAMLDALKKYGYHKADCNKQKLASMDAGQYPECICGFDEFMKQ